MAWADLLTHVKASDLVHKLTQYWTAIGIVAALISTMSYGALFASPQVYSEYDTFVSDQLRKWYSFLMGLAFLSSATCVLLSTLFYAQLNQLPRDKDIIVFVQKHQGKFGFATIFFQISVVILLLASFVYLVILFGHIAIAPWTFLFLGILLFGNTFRWFIQMQKDGIFLQKSSLLESPQ